VLRVILHCSAHMTWISHGIAVPLLLVAPEFLADEMAWATSMAFGHRPICDKCSEMDALSLLALLGFVVACFVAAFGGAVFRPGEWYEHLAEPSWRPPNRLFVPVWTVLYLIIAVSCWLVWPEVGFAITVLPVRQAMHRPIMGGSVSRGELTHAPCWWRRPDCSPWPRVGRRAVRHWRVRYSDKKAEPGRSTIHARCAARCMLISPIEFM
jgi:TspO/MBR family